MENSKLKRRSNYQIIVLVTVLITGFAVMIIWNRYDNSLFTKEKWRAHKTGNDPYNRYPGREATVDDLIRNYHLKQRDYSGILMLLGKPNFTRLHPEKGECTLEYEILVECINDIDPNHFKDLLIVFEAHGKIHPHARVKRWYIDERLPH